MDAATFRTDFPQFASATAYPDATVNFWLSFAAKYIDQTIWDDMYDIGLELITAHNLYIDGPLSATGQASTAAGGVRGIVSSKSVDRASIAFDSSRIAIEGAGLWNGSTYGLRFYQLLLLFGMGGYQL